MDVLDALKPRHAAIMDVVRFVIEDGEFVYLAHDLAEIGVAVIGFAGGLGPERGKEIIAQIVVVERRFGYVAQIDAVNVGEE
jgi:hypothetical protein